MTSTDIETIPSRPRGHDHAIRLAACSEILSDAMQWASSSSEAEVLSSLVDSFEHDGYDFAENLNDDHSWRPDSELVEILDNCSTHKHLKAAVKAWVLEHNVTTDLAIGNHVIARGKEGRIVAIYPDMAEVVIQPVEPDGRNYGAKGGWVHPYEQVTLADAGMAKAEGVT